jgi:tRNA-specific 2-thiouridylase
LYPSRNVITIGDEDDLLANSLIADQVRWVSGAPPADEFEAAVKVRYRAALQPATVRVLGGTIDLRFHRPQRAIAAGQAVVCYRNDEVLGGGIIATSHRLTERR